MFSARVAFRDAVTAQPPMQGWFKGPGPGAACINRAERIHWEFPHREQINLLGAA